MVLPFTVDDLEWKAKDKTLYPGVLKVLNTHVVPNECEPEEMYNSWASDT